MLLFLYFLYKVLVFWDIALRNATFKNPYYVTKSEIAQSHSLFLNVILIKGEK